MVHDTVFEILVYSCDQQTFAERMTASAKADMASVPNDGTGFWQEQLEDLIRRKLKPIRYNELVGCVDVYTYSGQIRAGYWFTDKARIMLGSNAKGVISWRGKIVEKHYNHSNLSSKEIFVDFRGALDLAVKQHRRLKHRFVDFVAFDRIGPHVDWRHALRGQDASEP